MPYSVPDSSAAKALIYSLHFAINKTQILKFMTKYQVILTYLCHCIRPMHLKLDKNEFLCAKTNSSSKGKSIGIGIAILLKPEYRCRYRRYFYAEISLSVSAILFSAVSLSIIGDTFTEYR
jgi:hypothetical protein